MELSLEKIKKLLMATNLPEKEVDMLAMFIQSLTPVQIDAASTVFNQISWDNKLVT